MELFVTDQELLDIATALPSTNGQRRLDLLLQQAWFLRQRDCARALQLCAELAPQLIDEAARARLELIEAEVTLLNGDLNKTALMLEQILPRFEQLADHTGCCDTLLLGSTLANEMAQTERRVTLRKQALEHARAMNDNLRIGIAEHVLVLWEMLRDAHTAWFHWRQHYPDDPAHLPLPQQSMAYHVMALHASMTNDNVPAISYWIKSFQSALVTGQIRQAIVNACNIGDAFNNLNEHQAALEWMQKGLELARPRGWPSAVGLALCQCGETLRRLGRFDVAEEMLNEALTQQHTYQKTRVYASGFAYLADLALDRKEYPQALQRFNELLARSDFLRHPDLQIAARRGRAQALTAMGFPEDALHSADDALQLARQAKDSHREIEVLKVLAKIHANHELPAPPGMLAANASLHYLQMACALGESIAGYTISGDVYDAMGEAYLRAGDVQRAYQSAQQAGKSRDKMQSNEATKRAIALQVQLQTERALALRAHQAQLSAAEARRAHALQQTSATLSRLCVIGQDITSRLEMENVLATLAHHVQASLEVNTMMIFLLDAERRILNRAYLQENGRSLPSKEISLDDPRADSARCARDKIEILRDWSDADEFPNHIPGSLVTRTSLFAPLLLGERVLGVMSVQSLTPHAFAEQERLIFRTLCAFGAIALDNALTYSQLQQAQERLVAQEKLAALGGLVAGVAHELNTPIGNCLIITSSLQDKAHHLQYKIEHNNLQRQDLLQFLQDTEQASQILLRGLGNAAGLVASFKQVAVDRASAQQRRFDLRQTCSETVATMMNQVRLAGHNLDNQIPAHIWMDSYPGPLGQVIANLIANSLSHAFVGRSNGHILLRTESVSEQEVALSFSDDGIGIAPHILPHVFTPFFSANTGQKEQAGCGLGLSISYNIVTSILGGTISVQSESGKGTVFTLRIPRQLQPGQ